MTDAALREAVCAFGKSLFERGLTFGSSGNISVKVEDGWLLTPTNVSMGSLDPARLSKLDNSGRHVGGDKPTKETFLHMGMYRRRETAGAVVHLHSTYSVAVSCLDGLDPRDVIPPITAYYVMRVGTLPLVPYLPPGDQALAPPSRPWPAGTTPCCSPTTARSSPARPSRPRSTRSRSWRRRPSCSCCCTAARCGR